MSFPNYLKSQNPFHVHYKYANCSGLLVFIIFISISKLAYGTCWEFSTWKLLPTQRFTWNEWKCNWMERLPSFVQESCSLLIAFLSSLPNLQTTFLKNFPTFNTLMMSGVLRPKSRIGRPKDFLSTSDYLHVVPLVCRLTQRSWGFKDYPRNTFHHSLCRSFSWQNNFAFLSSCCSPYIWPVTNWNQFCLQLLGVTFRPSAHHH